MARKIDGLKAFVEAFDALPTGTYRGEAHGRRYVVNKTTHVGGRSWKLLANELGGTDYISLNLYRTSKGALLRLVR